MLIHKSIYALKSTAHKLFTAMLLMALCSFPLLAAETEPPPTDDQLTIDLEAAAKPWSGDYDGMVERRLIRILTVYSKTFYFVEKGVQRGITHDVGQLLQNDINKNLKKNKQLKQKNLKVRVVYIPVARNELLTALAEGRGDIAMANLTITDARKKLVDFTNPVYPNVSEVLVSGAASPVITTLDDLAGKTIFTRKSSSYHESLLALNQRFAKEGKKAVIIKEMPETLEDEDLMEMVNAGLIPLIVVDQHKADFWKQIFPKLNVHADIAVRTGANVAWAMRKNSPQLKAVLDEFLVRNGKGTKQGNTLLQRYLRNANYVKDATSEEDRKKFETLIQFFQKYGDQYNVDWLLMVAQGYQESQLNQKVRSPVGAVGVMQVMPATGKDLNVGNIREVEPNIHAGIKYMRWMIDQYYGDEPMTNLDKALFSFASYNAGAGRISQLRTLAAKRGLNPNIWFNNVEYLAAEKIGAETVTYVSNIYKYYIAYRLLMEAKASKAQDVEKVKEQVK